MIPGGPVAFEHLIRDEDETFRIGQAIGGSLQGRDILAIEGPLGAGKTRLVRGIAAGLGIPAGDVSSPTYVLCREYGPAPAGLTLAHVDAYRLDGPVALDGIGWDDFAAADDVVTVVEWASRIAAALPPEAVWLELEPLGETSGPGERRRMKVRGGHASDEEHATTLRLLAGLRAAVG